MSRNDNESRKKKKSKKKAKRGLFKKIMLTILWLFIITVGLGVGFIYSIYNGAGELPLDKFKINNFTTIVYDKNGNEYGRLDATENRIYVSIDKVSPYLPKAFIAIEDERFEKHFGFDIKRTLAATVTYVLHGGKSDFGGSTITQQLIKKVTNDQDRSWQRKVREIVRAIQLEQNMSKNQIIELYMNIIYLGEGAYGIETAAHTYFNKSAAELSIAECAMLGGLAQAPSTVNPFSNYEAAKKRQGFVLDKMYELGFITKEQYEEAKNEDLTPNRGASSSKATNSYFIDAVVEAVIADLHEKYGVDEGEAQRMVYSNGYQIYTTVDPKIQNDIEEVYKDQNYFKLSNGKYDEDVQSAMVIIDYRKGDVVGLVGGAGEKATLRGLNRATQSARQPGSTMKPLGVYGPALENGVVTAATTFDEVPTTFKVGGKSWTPANNGRYRGLISVRKAIAVSSNVVASKTFMEVGTAASRSFLMNKLGITTITSNDVSGGSLALGGLTKGIIPLEHAASYGSYANSGIYIEPKLYTKVVDRDGNTILEKLSDVRQVISKQNAYIMTDMLEYAVNYGTGSEAKFPNMRVAGKTGTTNDSLDRWFGGYTPYYAASVWVGYDTPKKVNMSGNPAAKIWKAVMAKVHEGLENKAWEVPNGIIRREVCADSGKIPTELCKKDPRGTRVITEIFASDAVPTEVCDMHVEVEVCPDTNLLMNAACKRAVVGYNKVFLNKSYPEPPSRIPDDYEYIIPTTYCKFHEDLGIFGNDIDNTDDITIGGDDDDWLNVRSNRR